jgi:hypothetical protein
MAYFQEKLALQQLQETLFISTGELKVGAFYEKPCIMRILKASLRRNECLIPTLKLLDIYVKKIFAFGTKIIPSRNMLKGCKAP